MPYYVLFQVIEFVQFKERLQHSNQYLVARVEAPILQLKKNADNVEEAEVFFIFTTLTCHYLLSVNAFDDIIYVYVSSVCSW